MSKIPFEVSARAARLIGRENVSNADGAIIELVKNCYDADAKLCILYFDNKYSSVPQLLSACEYDTFIKEISPIELLTDNYVKNGQSFSLIHEIGSNEYAKLFDFFHSKASLYIIDNGDGMTEEIISKHWMNIGTDFKERNFTSDSGRIRSGAKGIGRFALDRLGSKCEMITRPKNSSVGYVWKVLWDEFENEGVGINNVFADLDERENIDLNEIIENVLMEYNQVKSNLELRPFSSGTILKISKLRDEWTESEINKVFLDLETLVPPFETNDIFKIFLVNSYKPEKFGQVTESLCDDYDYKVYAKLTNENKVEITMNRNEFDVSKVPSAIFELPELKKFPFDIETFLKGNYKIVREINELIPGYEKYLFKDAFKDLGPFDFTIYYLKLKDANRSEMSKYFQKRVNSSARNTWMERFGGIKIYRDNFMVRPYGETNGAAFDWLGLGDRVIKSPAAASHISGQWRVRSNQICGIINISRIDNVNFKDKSSREGFQENEYFEAFKNLLHSIIAMFERDRQTLIRAFNKYYDTVNEKASTVKKGTQLAKKIVAQKNTNNDNNDNKNDQEAPKEHILADTIIALTEEKEELVTELKLMRALASTGLVIASFTHQLQGLSSKLIARTIHLEKVLEKLISKEKLIGLPSNSNPFNLVEQFRTDDSTIEKWLDFSLKMIKKDKRRRKKTDIIKFLYSYKDGWSSALDFYNAKIKIKNSLDESLMFYAFQIDFDSILSNLISNSLDAFTKRKDRVISLREVSIEVKETIKHNNIRYMSISYSDTGPGLLSEIKDPYIIFEPHFTTKRDSAGNEIGTGLGMWIVKSTVEEYGGEVELVTETQGFSIHLHFPLKRDEGIIYEV